MRRAKPNRGRSRAVPETTAFDVYKHTRDNATQRSPLEISKLLFEAAFLSLLAVDTDIRNPLTNWVLDTAHEDLKAPVFIDYPDGLNDPDLRRTFQTKESVPEPQYTIATNHKPSR